MSTNNTMEDSMKENISAFVLSASLILAGYAAYRVTSRNSKSSLHKKIKSKTYVIIGASSGFGKGIAEKLGSYGANVVLAARRTELLEEIAANIRASGGNAQVVTSDISQAELVQHIADTAIEVFGSVDVWVNCTGVGIISRFWDAPLEDYSRLVDVNLKGIIYGSYAAVNLFRSQGYGTLINFGSIDSETPLAYQSVYSASKAGVRSLGDSLNQELRLDGYENIKVITIEPWAVDTPWWGHAANYSGGTPRMWPMNDPQLVIDAVIKASVARPQELPVGWLAKSSYLFHHLFPHLWERLSADVNHHYQITTAPPARATTGALYEPMATGTEIEGGVRERMKREREERKEG